MRKGVLEKALQTAKRRNRKRALPSIVGETFGFLSVQAERHEKLPTGKTRFEVFVVCVCGVRKWVEERNVRRGLTTSCGRCANKTHGASNTLEYAVWRSMVDRCTLPTHRAYPNYGGRGITVTPRWLDFAAFFEDMGPQPFKGASIDRIDNNQGYSPENCRWATSTTQGRNRRTNRLLTAFGKTQPISAWAEERGIRHNTLCYRLNNGWPPEKALMLRPNFTNRHNK